MTVRFGRAPSGQFSTPQRGVSPDRAAQSMACNLELLISSSTSGCASVTSKATAPTVGALTRSRGSQNASQADTHNATKTSLGRRVWDKRAGLLLRWPPIATYSSLRAGC